MNNNEATATTATRCSSGYTTKVIHKAVTRKGKPGIWPACGTWRVELPFAPRPNDLPVTCSKC